MFCLQSPPEGSNKMAKVLLSERGPVYKPDMGIPPYASEVIHPRSLCKLTMGLFIVLPWTYLFICSGPSLASGTAPNNTAVKKTMCSCVNSASCASQ